MLIIDNEAVEQVLTPAGAVAALEEGHRELARGGAVFAPSYRVFTPRKAADYGPRFPAGGDPTHHVFTSLTGAIASLDITCNRVDSDLITYVRRDGALREVRVPGTPDRKFCGLVHLYDSRTGELLAMIHDGYLQKFRVAGTAALGAKYLARHDAKVMALIGTGWQAQAQVLCQAVVRSLDRVMVFSPTPGHSEAFARRWSEPAGVEIVVARSVREAVDAADVVVTATNAPEPVVKGEWLRPGQFVTGVKILELDLAGWERCDVVATTRHGGGWRRYAIGGAEAIPEHGREYWGKPSGLDWDSLPLLGDVMIGGHPGRTSDEQLTGLYLKGDGIQFAAIGAHVYQLCRERGLGTEIPRDLFLQDERYVP